MPLILAVEPDRRQAAQLKKLVRTGVGAELLLAETTEGALDAIGQRIPDLVLVPALLSPKDDEALATALRVIATAAHVQTLTIPAFATPTAGVRKTGGMLAKLGLGRVQDAALEGCDPVVFAEQIAAYLAEAAAARALEEDDEDQPAAPTPVVSLEPPMESVEAEFEVEAEVQAEAEVETEVLEAEAEAEVELFEAEVDVEVLQAAAEVDGDADVLVIEADGLDLGAFVAELEVVNPDAHPAPVAALPVEPEPLQEESEPEPDSLVESEFWNASALRPQPAWPRLDGPSRVEKPAAAPPPPAVAPSQPARPEWTVMLEALRCDIDRLRSERTAATPPVRRAEEAIPAAAANKTHGAPAAPRKKKHKKDPAPVQDEWGFFDPAQCGFTALLAKLDEISGSNDETPERR